VRIAYDVTPLSHPRTGVGNYILGALAGMLEAGGGHELVAFGPVSIRGRALLDATLDGRAIRACGIGAVFTQPRHRGRGYARTLIERLIERAAADGLPRLRDPYHFLSRVHSGTAFHFNGVGSHA